MRDFAGAIAVVTGGGSGIGEAIALACADAGMDVAVADVEADSAERVAEAVRGRGRRSFAMAVDVSSAAAVRELAQRTCDELGDCRLLFNNAGVLVRGSVATHSEGDWRWVHGVNVHGVVNGLAAFLPGMLELDGERHIVNTASVGGLYPFAKLSVYTSSKYAVVGLSECLRLDLAGRGVGVSVLCPGGVQTRILESDRNRPDALPGAPGGREAALEMASRAPEEDRMEPAVVARITLDAVRNDEFYIVTHPSHRVLVEARFASILEAFDAAERRGSS